MNADFGKSIIDDTLSIINMIVGPFYRYSFSDVPIDIDLALGASLSAEIGSQSNFQLGIGGYLGASYSIRESIALMLGLNLGYDMLKAALNNADTSFSGAFYVSPTMGVGFSY